MTGDVTEAAAAAGRDLPDYFTPLLGRLGMSGTMAGIVDQLLAVLCGVLAALLLWAVLNRILVSVVTRLVHFTDNKWDDAILDSRMIHRAVKIIPAAVLCAAVPWLLRNEVATWVMHTALSVYVVVMAVKVVFSLTKALDSVYRTKSSYTEKPLQVFFQIINVAAIFLGGIGVISIVFDKSVGALLTGLGASMAVILLIFKDSILGFVSGWQLSANDQLRVGDWITVPKYGADGDVIEMSLYSVKVRNFDQTITTIPPYALISDSFQNWRGMKEAGGRRIKRSVFIDIRSVRFCTEQMLEHFRKIDLVSDYVVKMQAELDRRNEQMKGKDGVNLLRQTNIGVFRAYLVEYLRHNPEISNNMTCMVRQLQPGEKGIPLEVYCFVAGTEWMHYENVQSDIFDHIMAVVPEFGLEIYQYPAGTSWQPGS